MRYDVIVIGAGIVGVSVALHLQAAGRSVILVDKVGAAGTGTSYGNAGLVERASIIPYAFPRALSEIIRYGLNRSADAHYHASFLPRIAPFLFSYWRNSSPLRLAEAARDLLPLFEASVSEHDAFLNDSPNAAALFSRRGWIKAFHNGDALAAAVSDAEALASFGLTWEAMDSNGLAQIEPYVRNMAGAIHWKDPITALDPGAVTAAYADLFILRGGSLKAADAMGLRQEGTLWRVSAGNEVVCAREAVVAAGPWSADILGRLGYRFPLAVKRGYHMHYSLEAGTTLTHPLLDATTGYVLAPMAKGVRLTTGVEIAPRDARPTPVQLDRAEAAALRIFPLGKRVDPEPWMGFRPVFADMRPAIGKISGSDGLWAAFGHGHHGFTLGPATGRLLAEMICGRKPFVNPVPYSPTRFRGQVKS
uniref:NAD(P)/FAD-dependent oxidoreductase n=1 Tax=Mesorhizobium sp. WSM4875 TaxID=3038539 RepID=UPI00241760CD|nr:FAD-dependent oxidoreductase [Mesorhizobium sp. WSM4875]WIE94811.1 FAD-dependent oxidoreductase [Mesorhizobium sp. WSM4875]